MRQSETEQTQRQRESCRKEQWGARLRPAFGTNRDSTWPTINPATIQPIVPKTRSRGKSRAPSGTLANVIEFESTSVGE